MKFEPYSYPVAIARLSEGETSREPQNLRATRWLLDQPGGSLVVVTPQKRTNGVSLNRLIEHPGVLHLSWRGLSTSALSGRVLFAWPDRKHLNELWGADVDALAVIEWNENETEEWIKDARPIQLYADHDIEPEVLTSQAVVTEPLPNGVDGILEHIAGMAAGYLARNGTKKTNSKPT